MKNKADIHVERARKPPNTTFCKTTEGALELENGIQ